VYEVLIYKALVILAFIGFGVGFYQGYKYDGLLAGTALALCTSILVGLCIPLLIAIAVTGIMFVFCGG